MSKIIIIGAGGVGSVVAHKCAQLNEVFTEIVLASRTQSKCDAIAQSVFSRLAADRNLLRRLIWPCRAITSGSMASSSSSTSSDPPNSEYERSEPPGSPPPFQESRKRHDLHFSSCFLPVARLVSTFPAGSFCLQPLRHCSRLHHLHLRTEYHHHLFSSSQLP